MKKSYVESPEIFGYFVDSQYIRVTKQKYTPSMNKDRQIVSELRNFFTESGSGQPAKCR